MDSFWFLVKFREFQRFHADYLNWPWFTLSRKKTSARGQPTSELTRILCPGRKKGTMHKIWKFFLNQFYSLSTHGLARKRATHFPHVATCLHGKFAAPTLPHLVLVRSSLEVSNGFEWVHHNWKLRIACYCNGNCPKADFISLLRCSFAVSSPRDEVSYYF